MELMWPVARSVNTEQVTEARVCFFVVVHSVAFNFHNSIRIWKRVAAQSRQNADDDGNDDDDAVARPT